MGYKRSFHSFFSTSSCIEQQECDSCRKNKHVQCLPAELNAGEYFEVRLCKECLLELAAELEPSKKDRLE